MNLPEEHVTTTRELIISGVVTVVLLADVVGLFWLGGRGAMATP